MRLLPGTNIEDSLQGSTGRKKKQSGRITLELMFSRLKGKPANVNVEQGSGFAELDEVASKYASATSVRTNCTDAVIPMTIAAE